MRVVASVCLLLTLFCCIGSWVAISHATTPDDYIPDYYENERYQSSGIIGWKWVFILATVITLYFIRSSQMRGRERAGSAVVVYLMSVGVVLFLLHFFMFQVTGW